MQIPNNNIASGRLPNATGILVRDDAQARPETNNRVEAPSRPSANRSTAIDQDEILRAAEAIQSSRVQRLNDIESAPLRTQQALNSYQQTETAAQAYEFGELVGVDLFV